MKDKVDNTKKTISIINGAFGTEKDEAEKNLDKLISEMKAKRENMSVSPRDLAALIEGVKNHRFASLSEERDIYKQAFLSAIEILLDKKR